MANSSPEQKPSTLTPDHQPPLKIRPPGEPTSQPTPEPTPATEPQPLPTGPSVPPATEPSTPLKPSSRLSQPLKIGLFLFIFTALAVGGGWAALYFTAPVLKPADVLPADTAVYGSILIQPGHEQFKILGELVRRFPKGDDLIAWLKKQFVEDEKFSEVWNGLTVIIKELKLTHISTAARLDQETGRMDIFVILPSTAKIDFVQFAERFGRLTESFSGSPKAEKQEVARDISYYRGVPIVHSTFSTAGKSSGLLNFPDPKSLKARALDFFNPRAGNSYPPGDDPSVAPSPPKTVESWVTWHRSVGLIATNSEEAIKDSIDRILVKAGTLRLLKKSGNSLSQLKEFKAFQDAGNEQDGLLDYWLNLNLLKEISEKITAEALQVSADPGQKDSWFVLKDPGRLAASLAQSLYAQEFLDQDFLAGSLWFGSDGINSRVVANAAKDQPPLKTFKPPGSLTQKMPAKLGSRWISFWSEFENPKKVFSDFVEFLRQQENLEPEELEALLKKAFGDVAEKIGIRLDDELLPLLSGRAVIAGLTFPNLMSDLLVMLEVSDPAAVRQLFDKSAQYYRTNELCITQSDHTLFFSPTKTPGPDAKLPALPSGSVPLPEPSPSLPPEKICKPYRFSSTEDQERIIHRVEDFSLSYGLQKNWLLVAFQPETLELAMSSLDKPAAKNLFDSQAFQAQFSWLASDLELIDLSFLYFEGLWNTASAFLEDFVGLTAMLPEGLDDVVRAYLKVLRSTGGASWLTTDGTVRGRNLLLIEDLPGDEKERIEALIDQLKNSFLESSVYPIE